MRVADQRLLLIHNIMKYFADYMKERVYAVDEKTGKGVMVDEDGVYNVQKDIARIPWLSEENGIGFLVEEMTKEEFENYGKTWDWGAYPSLGEEQKHSWRNYMKTISL